MQPRAFASFAWAALLVLVFTMRAAAPQTVLLARVDDRPAVAVPVLHSSGGTLVEVDSIGKALRVAVSGKNASRTIELDGDRFVITAGSFAIRLEGTQTGVLAVAPVLRGGKLYISPSDVGVLFGVTCTLHGSLLDFATTKTAPFKVTETRVVRAPRLVRAIVQGAPNAAPALDQNYARVRLTLLDSASSRQQNLEAEVSGKTFHAAGGLSGSDSSYSGSGVLLVGNQDRSLALGNVGDPMQGIILRGGMAVGAIASDLTRGVSISATKRDDGRTILSAQRSYGTSTVQYALLSHGFRPDQALVRISQEIPVRWADVRSEEILSTRGVGLGISAQTHGKFFADTTLSYAGEGLPLRPSDAPLRIGVGEIVSRVLTVRAGFGSGRHQTGQVYGAVSLTSKSASLTFTDSSSYRSIDGTYTRGRFNSEFSAGFGNRQVGIYTRSTYSTPRADLEFFTQSTSGANPYNNMTLQWRQRRLYGLALGLERIRSGSSARLGPVIGIQVPFGKTFGLELAMHPSVAGNSMRVSFVKTLSLQPRRERPRNITIRTEGRDGAQLRVLLDGIAVEQFAGPATTVTVPGGNHYVSVATADGTYASLPVRSEQTSSINAELWPVRSVEGQLVVKGPPELVAGIPLSGVTVVLSPGQYIATTDEQGKFSFPMQPLSPKSTLSINPLTLVPQLLAPASVALPASGPVTIELVSAKHLSVVP